MHALEAASNCVTTWVHPKLSIGWASQQAERAVEFLPSSGDWKKLKTSFSIHQFDLCRIANHETFARTVAPSLHSILVEPRITVPTGHAYRLHESLSQHTTGTMSGTATQPPQSTGSLKLDSLKQNAEAAVEPKKLSGVALYSRFAFAGAVCCSVTHGGLTPVDV